MAGELPLGLGASQPDNARAIHLAPLEPGDRVLLYTDGVTDARLEGPAAVGSARPP